MNANNLFAARRNMLASVSTPATKLAAEEREGAIFKAILTYGLQEQFMLPLQTAKSADEFSATPGCLASLVSAALNRQRNAWVSAVWRDDMPDAEKQRLSAAQAQSECQIQAWGVSHPDDDPENDNGQPELEKVVDIRTEAEIVDTVALCKSIVRSVANIKAKEVQWLSGQQRTILVKDDKGQIVIDPKTNMPLRETHWVIPPADRPMGEWLLDSITKNQHKDSFWYTKLTYARFARADLDIPHHPGEIHELREQFEEHLSEEIEIDGVKTTRLFEITTKIANKKFAQWCDLIQQGKPGSADLNVWIAYSPERAAMQQKFLDSVELLEFLEEQEKAQARMDERAARRARLEKIGQPATAAAQPAAAAATTASQSAVPPVRAGYTYGMTPIYRGGR